MAKRGKNNIIQFPSGARPQDSMQRRGKPNNSYPPQQAVDPSAFNQYLNEFMSECVEDGIARITKNSPRFYGQGAFILKYIDNESIKSSFYDEINRQMRGKNPQSTVIDWQLIKKNILSGIERGDFFDSKGREIILRKSLENRVHPNFGWRTRRFLNKIKGHEDYLDSAIDSFTQLYDLMHSGNYAESMPEGMEEAITYIRNAGFADAALNILYDNGSGVMKRKDYLRYKQSLRENVEDKVAYTQKSLADYVSREAAAIFVIAGFFLMLIGNNITGNIIGISKTDSSGLVIGGLLLIAGFALFFLRRRMKK